MDKDREVMHIKELMSFTTVKWTFKVTITPSHRKHIIEVTSIQKIYRITSKRPHNRVLYTERKTVCSVRSKTKNDIHTICMCRFRSGQPLSIDVIVILNRVDTK